MRLTMEQKVHLCGMCKDLTYGLDGKNKEVCLDRHHKVWLRDIVHCNLWDTFKYLVLTGEEMPHTTLFVDEVIGRGSTKTWVKR